MLKTKAEADALLRYVVTTFAPVLSGGSDVLIRLQREIVEAAGRKAVDASVRIALEALRPLMCDKLEAQAALDEVEFASLALVFMKSPLMCICAAAAMIFRGSLA